MYKIICVTNRRLAEGDFFVQLEKIVSAGVDYVILREKDLDKDAYRKMAERAETVCEKYHVPLILHTYTETAVQIGSGNIHLTFPGFLALEEQEKKEFDLIGVSVHSVEEAVSAWKEGASYLTAGHIFATDCKKGVPPRGLAFLEEVCHSVKIPVYAIGGIVPENAKACIESGAAGVCLMSSFMKTKNPKKFLETMTEN